jgi:hypothetical protein
MSADNAKPAGKPCHKCATNRRRAGIRYCGKCESLIRRQWKANRYLVNVPKDRPARGDQLLEQS